MSIYFFVGPQNFVRFSARCQCLPPGARTAQALVDNVMSKLKSIVNERLSGRSGGGSSQGGGGGGSKSVRLASL